MGFRIAIIGAGISGLSVAKMLHNNIETHIYETLAKPGGLISCDTVQGHVYHKIGGHIFNSKIPEVLNWFWSVFSKEDFLLHERKAQISLRDKIIGYPIENYLYKLDKHLAKPIIEELLTIQASTNKKQAANFKEFLIQTFGETLFELYFKPYNQKIWQSPLSQIPLEWLEGKLPMPNVPEIIMSNILREEEKNMVHASFYYSKTKGSQFIADTLAQGLNLHCKQKIGSLEKIQGKWQINGKGNFDAIIYTGNIKKLPGIVKSKNSFLHNFPTKNLTAHGTSNILCETQHANSTWLYIPDKNCMAHRIIYTGNLSPNNYPKGNRPGCVVEFTGKLSEQKMKEEIKKLPGNLLPIACNYKEYTYPVQNAKTRKTIQDLKQTLEPENIFLLGRFAEWEYYNMDKCMQGAMKVSKKITMKSK